MEHSTLAAGHLSGDVITGESHKVRKVLRQAPFTQLSRGIDKRPKIRYGQPIDGGHTMEFLNSIRVFITSLSCVVVTWIMIYAIMDSFCDQELTSIGDIITIVVCDIYISTFCIVVWGKIKIKHLEWLLIND